MDYHQPVLPNEVMTYVEPQAGSVIADLTLGGGGYARLLLEKEPGIESYIGIDRDREAITHNRSLQKTFGQLKLMQSNFKDILAQSELRPVPKVDCIVVDLGVSSHQIDDPSRGFSFMHDGPLDMRMDQQQAETAKTLLQSTSEKDLADIIYQFGDERRSRLIARKLVEFRRKQPLETTLQLKEFLMRMIPGGFSSRQQSVRRVFQALRIAVNEELAGLELAIEQMVEWLKPGGRLLIISFHSLEDRMVKSTYRQLKMGDEGERVRILTKKPVQATVGECQVNPRAKSAKLRVLEKEII